MMGYETATVKSPLQCAGIEITLERLARIAAGIYLNRSELQQAISLQNRKKVPSSAAQKGIDGTTIERV
jgi:hypothetical protein